METAGDPPFESPFESPDVWLVLCALHTLSDIPHDRKVEAMRFVADAHRSQYERMNLPVPAWIALLEYTADLEEASPTKHESELLIPFALPRR